MKEKSNWGLAKNIIDGVTSLVNEWQNNCHGR